MKKQEKIEWLIYEAEQTFNTECDKNYWEFSYEITNSDITDLTFLIIKSRAKENTGMLFMCNKTYHITIGKFGGIKDAVIMEYEKRKGHNQLRYVKRGIFSL